MSPRFKDSKTLNWSVGAGKCGKEERRKEEDWKNV